MIVTVHIWTHDQTYDDKLVCDKLHTINNVAFFKRPLENQTKTKSLVNQHL